MTLYGQLPEDIQSKVDSLKTVIKNAKNDTTIAAAWQQWDNLIFFYDPDLDYELNLKVDSICDLNLQKEIDPISRKKFLEFKANALNNLGIISTDHSDYDGAAEYYEESLGIFEQLGNRKGISDAYNNLGLIADTEGDFQKSISLYTTSLKIREQIGDKKGIAGSLNNIANIYMALGDLETAKEYHQRSLETSLEIGNDYGTGNSYHNLGIISDKQKSPDEALAYIDSSLVYYKAINDMNNYASALMSIGIIQAEKGNREKAFEMYDESLSIYLEIGDDRGSISNVYMNIGINHLESGNLRNALEYLEKANSIALEIGQVRDIARISDDLSIVYEKLGRYKESLKALKTHIIYKDSMQNENNQNELIRQEFKYEYEKQAAADSIQAAEAAKLQEAELLAQKAENRQQKQQKYFSFIGLAIALIFGVFIFNRFRVTKKQKGIIEDQKKQVDEAFDELEEKNQEIIDSINYAKRIQSAILPTAAVVNAILPENFISYLPKDIVAGDFYWLEHVDNMVLFAAADCTGHGVPGAMVSVICNNGLNRAVREHNLTEPGQILDRTREIVIKEFEKSEEEVKDGMDIALCSLHGKTLKYAGAHNPLWVIRKDSEEVQEIKANKQPIGKFIDPLPYDTHTIELNEGDQFYIFSDGYIDQFGGEKGKKYKAKNFKQLLLEIRHLSMTEQKEKIEANFQKWKGSLEQLDDVCVIGVRV